mgnify:CR=1 FL=1|tara:strand:+ start:356 stop:661 length:306 start_codon:yes stop_codon:yes gene_type:complete
MKSPFYKTGNSKSPLFNHHTVKARRAQTQSESNNKEYEKRAYQLNLKPTDTMFSSTSRPGSKLKSQMYKIKGNQPFETNTQKQTRDKNSGKTTYHSIVPKN